MAVTRTYTRLGDRNVLYIRTISFTVDSRLNSRWSVVNTAAVKEILSKQGFVTPSAAEMSYSNGTFTLKYSGVLSDSELVDIVSVVEERLLAQLKTEGLRSACAKAIEKYYMYTASEASRLTVATMVADTIPVEGLTRDMVVTILIALLENL